MTTNFDAISKTPEEIVNPEKMKMIQRIDGLEPGEHSYVIDSHELCRILQESGPIPVGVHNYPHADNDDLVSVEFKLGMEISRAILSLFATRELAGSLAEELPVESRKGLEYLSE